MLALLKNRKFLIFFLASLIASISSGMTAFSLGVHVFKLSHSAFIKSLLTLSAFLPNLLLTPLAGILADRLDRGKLMIAGDGLSIIGLVLILYGLTRSKYVISYLLLDALISSSFASLVDPAFKASISNLVSPDDYIQASGLFQLSGAARFIVSPILAVAIISHFGLPLIIILDILSLITTMMALTYVARDLKKPRSFTSSNYLIDFQQGWACIQSHPLIRLLVFFSLVLTFMIGSIQELATPLLLAFTSSDRLGLLLSLASLALILSSLYIGIKGFQTDKLSLLTQLSGLCGLAMIGFGLRAWLITMTLAAFLFFACLPFLNAICDYYIRVEVDNDLQGRVFGLLSSLSQLGYLLAYALAGIAADFVFEPFLRQNGRLISILRQILGPGEGRGIGLYLVMLGVLLLCFSLWLAVRFEKLGGRHHDLQTDP
ncbi:MFS transporter [Aerococcus sp. Group 1]|uniref:MFS transporter n=1 Tax=Aerococcus urinae (strain CCUG 59500 / ACS-120-V-Col10a) TaxID=2976812 RepID=UPI00227B6694|nr:MFS transporter [Aerococcus sp. Group 1]MCY3030352.1 MFS transporter [Aerococcus sp. Group 1]